MNREPFKASNRACVTDLSQAESKSTLNCTVKLCHRTQILKANGYSGTYWH